MRSRWKPYAGDPGFKSTRFVTFSPSLATRQTRKLANIRQIMPVTVEWIGAGLEKVVVRVPAGSADRLDQNSNLMAT